MVNRISKKYFLAVAAVAIATVATLSVALNNSSSLSEVNLANVEALAIEALSVGNRVTCYSSWINGKTQTVYDCGPCTHVEVERGFNAGHCVYTGTNGTLN